MLFLVCTSLHPGLLPKAPSLGLRGLYSISQVSQFAVGVQQNPYKHNPYQPTNDIIHIYFFYRQG